MTGSIESLSQNLRPGRSSIVEPGDKAVLDLKPTAELFDLELAFARAEELSVETLLRLAQTPSAQARPCLLQWVIA